MRVALVYPRLSYPTGDPPLGLLYIASGLRAKTGIEPVLIDLTFEKHPWDKLRFELKDGEFDIVGISAMISTIRDAFGVAGMVKEVTPDSLVVLGGPQPSVDPASAINNDYIDIVVEGEGEEAFSNLVEASGEPSGIKSLWYKQDGQIMEPEKSDTVWPELDTIPFPAYDLMDWERYSKAWFQLDSVSPDLKGTNILATRGCPYRCSYCQPTLEKVFGKGLRKRSPDNVIDELAMLKGRYGIQSFVLADDTPTIDKGWALDFADKLIGRGLGLQFGMNMRVDMVDREMLAVMKKAGLAKIFIGVESASQRVLDDIYRKGTTIAQIQNAVQVARELELDVQGYFMLAAPGETISEMKETIRFARSLELTDATFNIATPLPGTELFRISSDAISIEPMDFDYYRVYPFKKSATGVSGLYVNMLRRFAYASFYLTQPRLGRLLRTLVSPSGLKKLILKLKRLI